MARKVRSDIKAGNPEKKSGLEAGAVRNPDGSDARSDKKLKTLREDFAKTQRTKTPGQSDLNGKPKKTVAVKKAPPAMASKSVITVDQLIASRRRIKSHPKTPSRLARSVSSALQKSAGK